MAIERPAMRGASALALYVAAAAVAVGAAAIASQMTLTQGPASEPMLTMIEPAQARPERLAALPVSPAAAIRPIAVAIAPGTAADRKAEVAPQSALSNLAQADVARSAELARLTIPPKPVPRPCRECGRDAVAEAPVRIAPAAVLTVADRAPDGPVPPMPVGVTAGGEGAEPGLLLRGGRAVVDGGSHIAGTAWTISGAAVDGIVRGVRRFTF